jgi:hypothetical protein
MLLKFIGLLPVLGALALCPLAHAQKSKNDDAATLAASYAWHDGEREQTVWLNPALVAEFSVVPGVESAVKRAHPAAAPEPGSRGFARIWRVGAPAAEQMLRGASAANAAGKVSPVFSDGAVDSARKRALPGDIIVKFKPDWTEARIVAWSSAQGLPIAGKLAIGPNIYVLKTGPGLEALETANRIHHSAEVVSAQPNWWVEATTR